jgi:DNA-binding LacI/PurR family transcriptional regulator
VKRPALALRVYDLVLRRIASRTWPSRRRCPSIRDLARELRVSPQPVREAFRLAAAQRLLTLGVKRRAVVLSGADRRASRLLAEHHRTAERRRLAILIPQEYFPLTGAPFHQQLAAAVASAAVPRGWSCRLVRIAAEDQYRQAQAVVRQFDTAFAVDPSPLKLAVLFMLGAHSFPMLSFNRCVPGIDHPVLTTNNYGASQQVGRLMADLGHRNLCFITTPKHEYLDVVKSSTNGWLDFLRESGLMDSCTMPLAYYKMPAMFPLLLDRLLRQTPPITAFLLDVAADLIYIGRDERFSRLRIPGDVSLAVMGSTTGTPWPSRHPPVTSFEVDWDRVGCCAIEMLDQMLAGNPHPKSIRVPLNIHLTESLGPAPH